MTTPGGDLSLIAPGSQVVIRDEEWLVRSVQETPADGLLVKVTGVGELVRDQDASFFTSLDHVQPLRPEDTRLVEDPTPGFRRSRLYLEALRRRTAIPAGDNRLAVGHRQLLDDLAFQREPARAALDQLRPRLLIGDSVGLGKTLEVGILLSELIRRGRGERILVVTPRHILEQFQHELWTRFSIPLVRLDSEGIERVRQNTPATRNPFTYYKRAIISIDTLKNAGRYRHHLERVGWDAVVIDEAHNLINRGTLNNQLARVLAPQCEALILTSATPHNGKPESFAELVRMLDPTAIADPSDYGREDIEHLFLRRFKKDVAAEVGSQWADRRPPEPVFLAANGAEDAVFDELAATWLYPEGSAPVTGPGSRLFPYTLLKAFLSSHRALAETVHNRLRHLDQRPDADADGRQSAALHELADLADKVESEGASKLDGLVEVLETIVVSRGSSTRAVVFSERHATLEWLRDELPGRLGLAEDAVQVLHGGLADVVQQQVVEDFALADTPVRVLLTGDIASEGVNLHRQCHQLIHFDLPWSLITTEQRNGRIDRYGQRHSPEIRALLLTPAHEQVRGDLTVLARLLDKEHHAHRTLGEAASLMGLHAERDEEEAIFRALAARREVDEVVPDEPADDFDLLMLIAGQDDAQPAETRPPDTLFDSDLAFLEEALRDAFDDADRELDIRREAEHSLISLVPPPDLLRRLDALPQSYLREQQIAERLRLTADRAVAEHTLSQARESSESIWPAIGFLSSQHPILDWAIDKVLVRVGRNEAPVLFADVDEPVVCIQGQYANAHGQPTVVEWLAVDRLDSTSPRICPLDEVLTDAGVDHRMRNPGTGDDPEALNRLVGPAVKAARGHLTEVCDERDAALRTRLDRHRRRIAAWAEQAEQLAATDRRRAEIDQTRAHADRLADRLATTGEPLIRVVAVLAPRPRPL